MARLEAEGIFKAFVARQDRLMVGFIVFHVFPNMQHKSSLWAYDSGHYIAPEFCDNAAWDWLAMWRAAETALRGMGVRVIMGHDNAIRPMEPAFKRLGYKARSRLYLKVIR
jgi:hypothetical protein